MSTVAKNLRTNTGTVVTPTAGPLSLGFRLFDDDTLKVYVNGLPRTDWTLTSAFVNGYDDSASITFDANLSAADVWIIDGSLTPDRSDDLLNGGISFVGRVNNELGRVWATLAEHGRDIGRSVRALSPLDPSADITPDDVANAQEYAEQAEYYALNTYPTPQQYGAAADGVTDDTTAFVDALAAGDIIYAKGTFLVSTPISIANKTILLDGTITGTISGDRTQIIKRTASQHNPFGAFTGFSTRSSRKMTTTAEHTGSFIQEATVLQSYGSGANGPSRTDACFLYENVKTDWLTSTQVGEIDGGFIVTWQGAYSDAGGLLFDIRKVQGGDGGAVSIEVASSWVNGSGVKQIATQAVVGLLEGAGGITGNTAATFTAEPRVGNPFAAYVANNRTDLTGGPVFDYAFFASTSRDAADEVFSVDAVTGEINTAGGIRVSATASKLTQMLYVSAAMDFASITTLERATLTATVTGAAVGDLVIVNPTNNYANSHLNFVGYVSGANTVTVVCQNVSTGTIDPGSMTIKIAVLRMTA